MKIRSIVVPTAAFLVAGSVCAQTSLTLYGVVDVGLTRGLGSVSNKIAVTSGGNATSRIGFRGTEDLGGGMAASFVLEGQFAADNGTGTSTNTNNQSSGTAVVPSGTQGFMFNRRSTVSMSGAWGEVRLGRDYTPQFYNTLKFDPFGILGVGASTISGSQVIGATSSRASNSIGYFLPATLGGFYGQVQHFRGENASNLPDDGTGSGVRFGYAKGPIDFAAHFSRIKYAIGDVNTKSIAGSYDFGIARAVAQVQHDTVGGSRPDGRGFLVGAVVPAGLGLIRVSYSGYRTTANGDPQTTKLAAGYVHNLSKRTAIYTAVARVRNKGGASVALGGAATAPNARSTGFDIGVRHAF